MELSGKKIENLLVAVKYTMYVAMLTYTRVIDHFHSALWISTISQFQRDDDMLRYFNELSTIGHSSKIINMKSLAKAQLSRHALVAKSPLKKEKR